MQANHMIEGLILSGAIDVGIACGVEAMSRVPIGAAMNPELGLGSPFPDDYGYEAVSQFESGAEIADRWGITRVAVIHRTGHLTAGEASVVMAVAAPHRQGAFEACAYLIDRLKQIVPIWKKEAYSDGAVWVGSEADYPRGQ